MTAWQPSASLQALRFRARLLKGMRAFFDARGLLEVQTPALSAAATSDPAIESFRLTGLAGQPDRYLHTSPEFPMKRLLAAYGCDCYQIAAVFRREESGPWHNPEFSLLEWYRLGFDQFDLMQEVEDLLHTVLLDVLPCLAPQRLSYREAFLAHTGLDPHVADVRALAQCAAAQGLQMQGSLSRDAWLDALMALHVTRSFASDRFTFVYDYPASQAALAKTVQREGVRVAERFEVYWGDLELANGFHELTDASEQRRRFEQDNQRRVAAGLAPVPIDTRLLAALESGLAPCAGVALGVDRLLMLALKATHIEAVQAFAFDRA